MVTSHPLADLFVFLIVVYVIYFAWTPFTTFIRNLLPLIGKLVAYLIAGSIAIGFMVMILIYPLHFILLSFALWILWRAFVFWVTAYRGE